MIELSALPQGLKAGHLAGSDGTAEAVPFQDCR